MSRIGDRLPLGCCAKGIPNEERKPLNPKLNSAARSAVNLAIYSKPLSVNCSKTTLSHKIPIELRTQEARTKHVEQ